MADALATGWISGSGRYVDRFEQALAQLIQVDECMSVVNGTAALHLACLAMGLKSRADVVVPALTYVASANAVAYCGGRPVFADCSRETWNCTVEDIEKALTPATVGVIAVHLYGLPAPVDEIASLCRSRGLWLIEDCAESIGAAIRGVPTGCFGDAATFSFYGNKIISTGEGGMLYVKDKDRRYLARLLRGQGMDPARRYWHPVLGYNYRMTNVSAAIGLGQVEMIDHHLSERRRIAERYRKQLTPLAAEGLIQLPACPAEVTGSHWLFSAVLTDGGSVRRDLIMQELADRYEIETRPFFVSMSDLPMYSTAAPLPITAFLSAHGINFPTYSGLKDEEVDEICEAVARVVKTTRIPAEAGRR